VRDKWDPARRYIYTCVRYIVFMLWICFGPGTGKCGQTMWRPARREKIYSRVYRCKSHTHTLVRHEWDTSETLFCVRVRVCAFVKDLSPFRVHVEFGDPFPRRCSAMCAYTPCYTVLQFFFLYYTSLYGCITRDALYSRLQWYIIAWNFLIVPYTHTRRRTTRLNYNIHDEIELVTLPRSRERVYLTPCERPIISPKPGVEAVNII